MGRIKIAVVMGSDSDYEVMNPAIQTLQDFGVDAFFDIVSAHRTPQKLYRFADMAVTNGFKVIIAGAGGSAHLPGMIAALTSLPVVAVPVKSKALSGQDSLLSIVQMPPGVPVGCMAIDGAKNAALYALRIVATYDTEIRKKMEKFMDDQTRDTENKKLPPP